MFSPEFLYKAVWRGLLVPSPMGGVELKDALGWLNRAVAKTSSESRATGENRKAGLGLIAKIAAGGIPTGNVLTHRLPADLPASGLCGFVPRPICLDWVSSAVAASSFRAGPAMLRTRTAGEPDAETTYFHSRATLGAWARETRLELHFRLPGSLYHNAERRFFVVVFLS